MFRSSLLPLHGHGYGTIGSNADSERGLAESADSRSHTHSTSMPLKLEIGNYRQNKEVFDAIWNGSSEKSNWLTELAKEEGLDLAAQTASSALITAAIYFVSTKILEKTPAQELLSNFVNQQWLGRKISELFCDRETRENLASIFAGASFVANVGNNLVITQAVTGALTRMGEPISALLKAMIKPQYGATHQARLKQNTIRMLTKHVKSHLNDLPDDRRENFKSAYENLRGEIDRVTSAFGPDYNEIKRLFDRVCLHLSYPIAMEDTYQLGKDGDPEKAKRIQAAQDSLTSSFMNPELTKKLDSLFTLARYSTINPEVGIVVAMFNGPPSTGKTFIANQFAKHVQNARLVKMSIDEFLMHTGAKSRPVAWGTYDDPDFDVIPEPHKSRITDALNNLNEVILIDEVNFVDDGKTPNDRDKMEDLKAALTIDPKDYPAVQRLRLKPNARPVVIFGTNHGFDFAKDKALGSRITTYIDFPNWSSEAYEKRIAERFGEIVNAMNDLHCRPVVLAAEKIFTEITPFILEKLAEHDSFRDDAKLYLREVHSAIKQEVAKIITALDQANVRGELDSRHDELVTQAKENIARYFQDVVDQYTKKEIDRDSKDNGKAAESATPGQQEESGAEMQQKVLQRISDLEASKETLTNDTIELARKYDTIIQSIFSSLRHEDQNDDQSTGTSTAPPSTADRLLRRNRVQSENEVGT